MEEIISEGLRLGAHFARPPGSRGCPALLVLPGFPRGAGRRGRRRATPMRRSCDRIAREAGWAGLTFTFRGTGSVGRRLLDRGLARRRARRGRRVATRAPTSPACGSRVPARRHARDRHRRRRRPRARHRDVRGARVVAHVGAGTRVVPRVRAPHRRVADRRLPARSRGVDPRDREPRPDRRGRAASRPGRGCSCTAAPTTSCRSTTRVGSPTARATASSCGSSPNGPHRLRHDPRAIAALLGWLDRQSA